MSKSNVALAELFAGFRYVRNPDASDRSPDPFEVFRHEEHPEQRFVVMVEADGGVSDKMFERIRKRLKGEPAW